MLSDPFLLSFLLACPALLVLICLESRRRNREDEKSYRKPGFNKHSITDLWVDVARGCHGAGRRAYRHDLPRLGHKGSVF